MTRDEAELLINALFDRRITVESFWDELGISFDDDEQNKKYYLINKTKENLAAHIWVGNDTACKMYSTGGLGNKTSKNGKRKFEIVTDTGARSVCFNCQNCLGLL